MLLSLLTLSTVVSQSPNASLTPAFVLETTLPIGTSVEFGEVNHLDLDPNGTVVVADDMNYRIYRFSTRGELIDSIGRRGRGPGEFESVAGFGVGPQGEIGLADIRVGRVVIFSPNGTPQATYHATVGPLMGLVWRGTHPIVKTTDFRDSVRFFALDIQSGKYEPVTAFAVGETANDATAVSCLYCRDALGPEGDVIVAAADTAYRISTLTRSGNVARLAHRTGVPPAQRSKDELNQLRRALARGPAAARARAEGGSTDQDMDRFKYHWRVHGLGVDHRGRLLALVQNDGFPHATIDVFGPDNEFIGTIVPGEPLSRLVVREDRALGIGEAKDGTPLVYVYRIVDH
jgi:hypothetical protein